jgi:predicted homoserine dehydrogenase-like protein
VFRREATGSSRAFVADAAATAKKDLQVGEILDGEGGYTVYGRLVRADESLQHGYLPIGLAGHAKLVRPVSQGATLTYGDVALDETLFSRRLRRDMEETEKAGTRG